MKAFTLTLVAIFAIPFSVYTFHAVRMLPLLEAATAEQCRTHDWPEHQHDAHVKFCKEYGYLN